MPIAPGRSVRANRANLTTLALGSLRSPWPHFALWAGVSPDSLRSLGAGVALDAASSDESLRTGRALWSQRSWRPAWRSRLSLQSLLPLRSLRAQFTLVALYSLRSDGALWPSRIPLRAD